MKKLLIFALLLIPVTSFAASSVRVLGSGSGSTSSTTKPSAKVVPTKATAAKPAAAQSGDSTTSRIGTVRAKPKTTLGTVSASSKTTTTNNAGSRFPVITPASSYNTVTKPQSGNVVSGAGAASLGFDDPRFDMIRKSNSGSPEEEWRAKGKAYGDLVDHRLDEGYVFMWIEE